MTETMTILLYSYVTELLLLHACVFKSTYVHSSDYCFQLFQWHRPYCLRSRCAFCRRCHFEVDLKHVATLKDLPLKDLPHMRLANCTCLAGVEAAEPGAGGFGCLLLLGLLYLWSTRICFLLLDGVCGCLFLQHGAHLHRIH